MNDANRELRWSRRLSVVPRWPVVPTINKQSVDQHVFHVTRIVMWLLPYHAQAVDDDPAFKFDVVRMALGHDDPEASTGDIPTPRKGPANYSAMPQKAIIVKVADILEAIMFLVEEREMGNKRVGAILLERRAALEAAWSHFKQVPGADISATAIMNAAVGAVMESHPAMEK